MTLTGPLFMSSACPAVPGRTASGITVRSRDLA